MKSFAIHLAGQTETIEIVAADNRRQALSAWNAGRGYITQAKAGGLYYLFISGVQYDATKL